MEIALKWSSPQFHFTNPFSLKMNKSNISQEKLRIISTSACIVLNIENWVVESVSKLDFYCRKVYLTGIKNFWLIFGKLWLDTLAQFGTVNKQNRIKMKSHENWKKSESENILDIREQK